MSERHQRNVRRAVRRHCDCFRFGCEPALRADVTFVIPVLVYFQKSQHVQTNTAITIAIPNMIPDSFRFLMRPVFAFRSSWPIEAVCWSRSRRRPVALMRFISWSSAPMLASSCVILDFGASAPRSLSSACPTESFVISATIESSPRNDNNDGLWHHIIVDPDQNGVLRVEGAETGFATAT
jgi:hypothetical protein